MKTIKSFFGTHSFPSTDHYVNFYPIAQLNGVTTSDVQMIKSLLSNTIAELEEVRGDYKFIAKELTDRDTKNVYWDRYNKVSKKINKLAVLQAKIKRNL